VIGAMKGVVFAMLGAGESGGEYYVFLYLIKSGNDKRELMGTRRVRVRSEFIPFKE
jgi:hypothetical protein